jgi:N-dimethylarginine dimethylaminohydrolase
MTYHAIYQNQHLKIDLDKIAERPEPKKVLMCSPDYFDIVDEKNVHMHAQIGSVEKQKALDQWTALKQTYESLIQLGALEEIQVLAGDKDCEDMVFAANQTLPWYDGKVILSNMYHESRKREVKHYAHFFLQQGYQCLPLAEKMVFEGMGDAIPHPSKKLIYGGFGHRTELAVYAQISHMLDCPIVTLEMINPKFYHLDTCFLPINQYTVMLCKEAFTEEAYAKIKSLFIEVIDIPEYLAANTFALNAHIIPTQNGVQAIIEKKASEVTQLLQDRNIRVWPVDTSEFMKSGGSVFCMKMMYY